MEISRGPYTVYTTTSMLIDYDVSWWWSERQWLLAVYHCLNRVTSPTPHANVAPAKAQAKCWCGVGAKPRLISVNVYVKPCYPTPDHRDPARPHTSYLLHRLSFLCHPGPFDAHYYQIRFALPSPRCIPAFANV